MADGRDLGSALLTCLLLDGGDLGWTAVSDHGLVGGRVQGCVDGDEAYELLAIFEDPESGSRRPGVVCVKVEYVCLMKDFLSFCVKIWAIGAINVALALRPREEK